MLKENRYQHQIALAKRIALVAEKISPVAMRRVDLRFINSEFSKQVSATEIEKVMKEVKPSSMADIGTNLRKRILEPLVYKLLPKVSGNPPFQPLIVCIITCSEPGQEGVNALCNEILQCKKTLMNNGWDTTAVKFCISQVGMLSKAAMEVIGGLIDEKDVVYCTVNPEKSISGYGELQGNKKALEAAGVVGAYFEDADE